MKLLMNCNRIPWTVLALTAIVLASTLLTFSQTSSPQPPIAPAPTYDLLLKGGHVIDPANHIDEVRDVAISAEQAG